MFLLFSELFVKIECEQQCKSHVVISEITQALNIATERSFLDISRVLQSFS